LSKRHQKTLAAVFAEPIRANIHWHDIESMLLALGCEAHEGSGSRVFFALNGIHFVFHRPHPQKEAGKRLVETVREFLLTAEVRP